MLAVFKKELKDYFLTPVGYIFIGLFLEVSSIIFYLYTFRSGEVSFYYVFYDSAIILTFIVGILTMNSFAGEKKNGTYQLIMTSPRSTLGVVLGKFFAALVVILVTELLSCTYLGIIAHFGTPDLSNLLTTLLGFLLLTMAYLSFGIFVSSLTDQPIIAYVITFIFFFGSMYLRQVSEVFSIISFVDLFAKFTNGIIPIEETIALLSFTLMSIALTVISIKRRKRVK